MNLVTTPHRTSGLRLSRRSAKGFSLVELLTVVAIIGILAAILIPVVGRVRETAKGSQCATNLRQTGVAIQTYTSDNKGFLPPVGHSSISPYFTADPRNFQHALLPYLSVANTTSWNTGTLQGKSYSPTLDCPGYKGEAGGVCFAPNQAVPDPNASGTTMNPWPGIFQVGQQFLVTRKGVKHSLIPPTATAILDRDLSAAEPNHSRFKNALYFDWHVGRVPVAN